MTTTAQEVTTPFNDNSRDAIETIPVRHGSIHVIDPDNSHSLALLRSAYNGVYKSCFPMKDERETWKDLLQYTKDGDTVVTLLGDDLNTRNPVIKGIAVIYPYPDEDKKQTIGLLGHLGIDAKYRDQGIGHVLYDACRTQMAGQAKEEGLKLACMVHECNPVDTKGDTMDPARRIAMYEKWGCVQIPVTYQQQPLTPDGESVPLVLMGETDPTTGKYPSKQSIKDYLYAMAAEAETNANTGPADENGIYLAAVKELDSPAFNHAYSAAIKKAKASLPPKFNDAAFAGESEYHANIRLVGILGDIKQQTFNKNARNIVEALRQNMREAGPGKRISIQKMCALVKKAAEGVAFATPQAKMDAVKVARSVALWSLKKLQDDPFVIQQRETEADRIECYKALAEGRVPNLKNPALATLLPAANFNGVTPDAAPAVAQRPRLLAQAR